MSSARKVLGNTAAQVIGKAVTAVISIIIVKLLAMYLGTAGFGMYTTVYEFLAFFGIAADFGIFQIAVREMSRHPERREQIFSNVLSLRILLTGISMAAAASAVWLIPSYAGTAIPMGVAIATLTTYFTLIHGTLSSVLQADLRIQWAVVAQVIGKFAALGYMAWMVLYAFPNDPAVGFNHLLIAGIVGNGLMLVLTYFFTRRLIPVRLAWDWEYLRSIILKALPYGTAIILATIYFRIDVILLSIMKGPEEVGVYGVAMRILENLQMIPVFFMNAALPVITRLLADNRTKLRKLLQYSFDFLLMLALPMIAGGFVLAFPFIAIVASPDFLSDISSGFYGSDIALRVLLFAMGLAFLGNLFNYTLLAGNQQLKVLYISAAAAVFNIIANILVIPEWGFRGAAATSVASEMIVIVAGWYLVSRMIGGGFQLKTAGKALVAAISMAAVIWWLQPITFAWMENKNVLILVPLGAAIYAAVLLATRAVTREHVALFARRSS